MRVWTRDGSFSRAPAPSRRPSCSHLRTPRSRRRRSGAPKPPSRAGLIPRRELPAGRPLRRPVAGGDHAAHARRRRRRHGPGPARGRARPRLPPRGRAARHLHHRRRQPLGQGAGHRPAAARALLVPVRDARPQQPGRALPDRAAARLARDGPLRLLLLRRLHARLLQRLRGAGPRGPRLRRLARRLHLRRDLLQLGDGRAVRDDPIGRENPYYPSILREAGDAAGVPREVRALPQRREPAARPPDVPDDRHLGRPRGPEQLRQRRRRRRPAAARALLARAPRRRLPGLLRGDAGVPPRAQPDLPHRAARAARSSC